MLAEAVALLGEDDWTKVAAGIPKRTAQQCMSRWVKALKKGGCLPILVAGREGGCVLVGPALQRWHPCSRR
jgi:hypothetical protein